MYIRWSQQNSNLIDELVPSYLTIVSILPAVRESALPAHPWMDFVEVGGPFRSSSMSTPRVLNIKPQGQHTNKDPKMYQTPRAVYL